MRTARPWKREATGTWHVWLNGKQRFLGRDEKAAHEKFRRLTQAGTTGEYTVRQVFQAYWKWAKANLAESTCKKAPVYSGIIYPGGEADAES